MQKQFGIRGRVARSDNGDADRNEERGAVCALLIAMLNQARGDIRTATKLGAAAPPNVQAQAQQAAEFLAAMEAWAT